MKVIFLAYSFSIFILKNHKCYEIITEFIAQSFSVSHLSSHFPYPQWEKELTADDRALRCRALSTVIASVNPGGAMGLSSQQIKSKQRTRKKEKDKNRHLLLPHSRPARSSAGWVRGANECAFQSRCQLTCQSITYLI